MRTVHWNELAKLDYYNNIDYLLREWSEKEAQKFIDEVNETEFILKQGNIDFQNTDIPGIKRRGRRIRLPVGRSGEDGAAALSGGREDGVGWLASGAGLNENGKILY